MKCNMKLPSDNDYESISNLIEVAVQNKHRPIESIFNIYELEAANTVNKALKSTTKSFKRAKDIAFKKYLSYLDTDESQALSMLQTTAVMSKCEAFFQIETENVQVSIKEYKQYIKSSISNLIDHFSGYDRADLKRPEADTLENNVDDIGEIFPEFKDLDGK